MKPHLKTIVAVFAVIIVGAIVTKSPVLQAQLAAPQQAPVPVIVNLAPQQYRVIDIGRFAVANGQTPAGTLEAILNEMGAQGWKAVTTSGTFIILMQ